MSKPFGAAAALTGLWAMFVLPSASPDDDSLNTLIHNKKFDAAVKYADDKLPAASRDAIAWTQIAKANEALNLPEKALACYLVAGRLDPEDYDAFMGAAKIYNNLDQPENALDYAGKALALNFTAEASWEYANACIKLNRAVDAKNALETVLQKDPDNAIANLELGRIYFNAKEFDKAAPLLRKSYTIQPDPDVAYMLGKTCLGLNDLDCAIEFFKATIAKNPSLLDANLELARLYFKKIKFSSAAEEYEKISSKIDLTAMDDYNRAISLEETNNSDLSFKAYVVAADKFGASKEPEALKSNAIAGLGFLQKKNYQAALGYFQRAINADPEAATIKGIYILFADAAVAAGDTAKAINSLEKALALDDKNIEASARLADLYEKSDMADKARQVYEKMISLSPNDPHVFHVLGDYDLRAKKYSDALSNFEKAYDLDHSKKSIEGVAASAAALDQWEKALEMYRKAIRMDPQNSGVLSSLAQCQAKTGDIEGAIVSYEQVVMLNPKATVEYKNLGDLYANQNKSEKAIGDYRTYLEKVPDDQEVAKKVGMYLYDQKQYKDAVTYLEMVKETGGKDNNFLMALGDCYFNVNNLKKALQVYEGVRKSNKTNIKFNIKPVLARLGQAYEKDADAAKAIEAYTAYTQQRGPKDPGVCFKAALLQENTNPLRAKKIYEDNIIAFPDDYRNYLHLGILYSKDKITSRKSAALLKKTSDIADTIPTVWFEMAQIYGKLGDEKEELNAYKKLVSLDPQNFAANKWLGITLMKNGAMADAMIHLEIAATLSPNDFEILMMLAKGYTQTNRFKEAIDILQKAKTLKSDDAELRMQLVDLYRKTGHNSNAVEELKQLIGIKRDNKTLAMYARSLVSEGNFKDAEEAIQNVRATDPENIEALMILGDAQRLQKKYDSAIETYKEIAYINPEYAPALYQRAEIYVLQNKYQWAKTFYERALRADPELAKAELGLAKVDNTTGNKNEYIQHLEKAMQLDPNNAEIKEEYGKAKK